jgi:hypothetical protein
VLDRNGRWKENKTYMEPTKKTRKPACELTDLDMQTFPIWEFALDEEGVEEQDETWVRPVDARNIPAQEYSQLVSTVFTVRSGEKFSGYLVVSPVSSTAQVLDHSGGALFCAGKQCFLTDMNGSALDFMKHKSFEELQSALKKTPSEIFPLEYELVIPIESESQLRRGVFEAPEKSDT